MMEYNHPTSLNKSKSGQKYLPLIAVIVITGGLACYLVSDSIPVNDSLQVTTAIYQPDADHPEQDTCYGDFDADGQEDMAIVIDNSEKQSSRLLIISTNIMSGEKYVVFSENYSDKIKISAFRKGAKIIMNNDSPEASAVDGIIATGEDVKLAVVYDKQLQKFKTFYQE
ncbi:hypothetical protein SAMN05660461_5357 [Chitinophaga ginsengisegetis]|uniref:FG-GAP repeat-containing protein n=1 Tax=Chitinophaga ginsengisegetis TaxID=393003 RepID=A0A1T5PAQ5_9BACT|nr:hypothetical protein [Chitinophaga ginsengisegetis]SKD09468.1 hypothetical protein SAMN05660461_5357 [Chitinophaga ginsengisegetis]